MSSVFYTKSQSLPAPSPGTLVFKKYQNGMKSTGSSRSRPQIYTLQEGLVTSWRQYVAGGTWYSPKDPTSRNALHGPMMPFVGTMWVAGRNKAYSRLKDAVNSEEAAIGTSMAEWRESFGMIANRGIGLYRAYKALRKGDFRKFLKELSVDPKRKHRSRLRAGAHEVSGLWLEYWFGWSPLVNDIYSACGQLSEPLPEGRYRGRSRSRGTRSDATGRVDFTWRCETGAKFRLVSPNQYLMAQLGLVNPALIAWELVPFSFFADWCFDVSSFIGSFSDFVGLEVTDAYTSETVSGTWVVNPLPSHSTGAYRCRQAFSERRTELIRPLPNFDVLSNLGVSKTRAASALSLLTQILGSR